MQLAWIERLFSRLATLYGSAFGRQWDGSNIGEVKSAWAERLGGFSAPQIGAALRACDDRQYPPNLPEFIDLCRSAVRREEKPKEIEAPRISAEEAAARLEKIEAITAKKSGYDYRAWAKDLIRCHESGEKLLPIQIEMAHEAMGAEP
jgi:hypothetical protein